MSRENLQLATDALKAAMAKPAPDFATMNEVFDPEHVFVPIAFDLGHVRGGRGWQEFLREQAQYGHSAESSTPVSWEADLEGAVDVGGDKVLAVCTATFRGASSGVDIEQRSWLVLTVRNGRLLRTEVYNEPAEALEAVGLGE